VTVSSAGDTAGRGILDGEGALVESAQAERAEVDIPFAVVDLNQADGFLAQGLADVDSLLVPADAAAATDTADLKWAGYASGGSWAG
jgi:hypothetical protein